MISPNLSADQLLFGLGNLLTGLLESAARRNQLSQSECTSSKSDFLTRLFSHELTSFSIEVYNREDGGEVNEKFTIRYVPKMAPFGEHAIFSRLQPKTYNLKH